MLITHRRPNVGLMKKMDTVCCLLYFHYKSRGMNKAHQSYSYFRKLREGKLLLKSRPEEVTVTILKTKSKQPK